MDRKALDALVAGLESADAFERLDAEKRLRGVARRDFGFRWDDPEASRVRALERLKAWAEEQARERRESKKAAAQAGALSLASLAGLSPEEAGKKLEALLAKAPSLSALALGRPPCGECGSRPATVEVVEVRGRKSSGVLRLCDPCAARRGEIREA